MKSTKWWTIQLAFHSKVGPYRDTQFLNNYKTVVNYVQTALCLSKIATVCTVATTNNCTWKSNPVLFPIIIRVLPSSEGKLQGILQFNFDDVAEPVTVILVYKFPE